ncbi:hypothetical protein NL676_035528 [Syzygium grande]|nr:hypothetical protein NL676_035528 [Syzygium grande]
MENDGDAAAAASAAASHQPEPGRGAGGKVRRPPNRNPRATPYARPNSNRPPAAGGGGGWLSKLVDPAYRLISGGATRMLPSLFSRPPSPVSLPPLSDDDDDEDEDEDEDKSKREIDQDVRGSNHEGNSDMQLGLSRSAEVGNAVASDVPKKNCF